MVREIKVFLVFSNGKCRIFLLNFFTFAYIIFPAYWKHQTHGHFCVCYLFIFLLAANIDRIPLFVSISRRKAPLLLRLLKCTQPKTFAIYSTLIISVFCFWTGLLNYPSDFSSEFCTSNKSNFSSLVNSAVSNLLTEQLSLVVALLDINYYHFYLCQSQLDSE